MPFQITKQDNRRSVSSLREGFEGLLLGLIPKVCCKAGSMLRR